MARHVTEDIRSRLVAAKFDEDTYSCLSFLVMALGCAGELVGSLSYPGVRQPDQTNQQNQWRLLADIYFDCAFKKIHIAQAEFSAEAVQCLFFTG